MSTLTDHQMQTLCAQALGLKFRDQDGVYLEIPNPLHFTHESQPVSYWMEYRPLHDKAQAMDLLCWLVRHNDNEYMDISNHVFFYAHQKFHFTQLGGFFRSDHLCRAIVECVSKIQALALVSGTPPDEATSQMDKPL